MEPYVLVLAVMIAGAPQLHAREFASETSCWQWVKLFTLGPGSGVAQCIPQHEFRATFPGVTAEREMT